MLKPQIDAAMQKVCVQADFISGHEVKELEQQLAEYVGVKHCITCANGTDALTLVLMAWGIGPGDAHPGARFHLLCKWRNGGV